MNLEELYKRKKKGPKDKEQFDWEPQRPNHDWTLPVFNIAVPKSNNGLASTREILSKIYAFIKLIQRKRFNRINNPLYRMITEILTLTRNVKSPPHPQIH